MAPVTLEALAARVEKLEEALARLVGEKKPEPIMFKDWRKAVGLMPGGDDELQRGIDEAGRQIREAEHLSADTDSQESGQ